MNDMVIVFSDFLPPQLREPCSFAGSGFPFMRATKENAQWVLDAHDECWGEKWVPDPAIVELASK